MKRTLLVFCLLIAVGVVSFLVGRRLGYAERGPEVARARAELEQAREQASANEVRLRREARAEREKEFARFRRELDAQRDRRLLEDRLGIRIMGAAQDFAERPLLNPSQRYTGQAVQMEDVLGALSVVTKELSLYPDEVVQKVGLRRIILARNLKTGPYGLGGFVTGLGAMYLDTGRTDEELARTFHHELFHLIDRVALKQVWQEDKEWSALNPPAVTYEPHQDLLTDSQWSGLPLERRKGFISAYARWAPSEDKAELFEWMAYRPNALDYRQDGDDVIKAKRQLLSKRLASVHDDFADRFWARARAAESARSR